MAPTRKKSAYNVQWAKGIVSNRSIEFMEFVAICLDDNNFVDAVYNLLPFDKCVQSKMKMEDDASIVKNMGISVMRMEIDPPRFSLGVSIEIAGRGGDEPTNSTSFIAGYRTIEELRTYVRTEDFKKRAVENIEKQIVQLLYKAT